MFFDIGDYLSSQFNNLFVPTPFYPFFPFQCVLLPVIQQFVVQLLFPILGINNASCHPKQEEDDCDGEENTMNKSI